jgi:hypothetical protein
MEGQGTAKTRDVACGGVPCFRTVLSFGLLRKERGTHWGLPINRPAFEGGVSALGLGRKASRSAQRMLDI